MTATSSRMRGAVAIVLCSACAPIPAAAAPYPIAPGHRQPAAMVRALKHYVVGKYGDGPGLQPFHHQCKRITTRRYDCTWEVNGNGAPGDYRFEVDGTARVILHGRRWRVRHVVVACAPDGRHDVCGS